jgi:hypothetical protein
MFAAVASASLVGCGADSTSGTTTRELSPPTASTPAAMTTSAHTSPADAIAAQLREAGFDATVVPVDVTGPGVDAQLSVSLDRGAVSVYVYRTAASARAVRKTFISLERDRPDQVEVRRVRNVLYVGTVEEPAVLPNSEFVRVVETGSAP